MATASATNRHPRPRSRDEFKIAIVCALEVESRAVKAVFDDTWEPPAYSKALDDPNSYTAGRIGEHNVVLAFLPSMGSNATSAALANLTKSYRAISLALIVGVCGGAPNGESGKDVALGDVVIADRVVRYGYGRRFADGLKRKRSHPEISSPGQDVASFIHKLKSYRKEITESLISLLRKMTVDEHFARPPASTDLLFKSSYRHKHQITGICQVCDACLSERDSVCEIALRASCAELGCHESHTVQRSRLETATDEASDWTAIHFGLVASADEVMRSAVDRDEIARRDNAIAFEMEGSGTQGNISTVIVKSVCDYADSHKNKEWQPYASAVAACCMKGMLEHYAAVDLQSPHSLLSVADDDRDYFMIPNRRVRYFKGRHDELLRLDQILRSGPQTSGPRIGVVQGMGGQGKTQLALEYCRKKRNEPFKCILWLDANSEDSLMAGYELAADYFQQNERLPDSRNGKVKFVLRKLSAWPDRWLVVFDNYDNVSAYNIRDYIPDGDNGSVLITSRHKATNRLVQDRNNDFIELSGLDKDSASMLLAQQCGADVTKADQVEQEKILERLGYHPLAIVQAATYIDQARIRLDQFLALYDKKRRNILDSVPELSEYRRKLGESEQEMALSVFTTWDLSFQQLEEQCSVAKVEPKLMTMLSLFDCNNISEDILQAWPTYGFPSLDLLNVEEHFYESDEWSSERFIGAVVKLSDLSLLQITSPPGESICQLRMHPLVKDWIGLRTNPKTLQQMCYAVIKLLSQFLRDARKDKLYNLSASKKQELVLHIRSQRLNWQEILPESHELLTDREKQRIFRAQRDIAKFLSSELHYELCEDILHKLVHDQHALLGAEHEESILTMDNLTYVYWKQNRYKEAEVVGEQNLETSKRALGDMHPETIANMNRLALIYSAQGRLSEAESLHLRELELIQQSPGSDHPSRLSIMNNLALIYQKQERLKEAEETLHRVIESRKLLYGDNHGLHPRMLGTLEVLGTLYVDQERWKEAETLYLDVIEAKKQVYGEEHPCTWETIACLADSYQTSGRLSESETLYAQLVNSKKQVLGEHHPLYLSGNIDLSDVLCDQGRYHEGEQLLRGLLGIWTERLGESDERILQAKTNLATILSQQDMPNEAEALFRAVLLSEEATLGALNPSTSRSAKRLARVLESQSKDREALEYYLKALSASLHCYGHNHSLTKSCKEGLSELLEKLHKGKGTLDWSQASNMVKEAGFGDLIVEQTIERTA